MSHFASNTACINGALRLVGGLNQYEGRLEICINNVWGTICDNMWDSTDASVACKQLGYSENSEFNIEPGRSGFRTERKH